MERPQPPQWPRLAGHPPPLRPCPLLVLAPARATQAQANTPLLFSSLLSASNLHTLSAVRLYLKQGPVLSLTEGGAPGGPLCCPCP